MPAYSSQYNTAGVQQDPGSAWVNYYASLPGASQFMLRNDDKTAFASYADLNGEGQGQSFKEWLPRQYQKYFANFSRKMIQQPFAPGFSSFAEFLSGIHPENDFSDQSPRDQGANFYGYAPTMRMGRE